MSPFKRRRQFELLEPRNQPAATLAAIPQLATYYAATPGMVLAPAATISDPAPHFANSQLTVSVTNAGGNDRLSIAAGSNVTITGSSAPLAITVNGTAIGTFAGPAMGTQALVVDFNAAATQSAVQAVLRQVEFWNIGSSPALSTRAAHFVFHDGQNVASSSVTEQIHILPVTPQVLLTPAVLADMRQKAAANTPQWQAFKARLDDLLPQVIGPGEYQGSMLTYLSDFALGYQVLKDNPNTTATARNYADKALALLKSGLHDYQRGDPALQYLARGNATQTSYALAGNGILPDTLRVLVSPIRTDTITRGSTPGGYDDVEDTAQFLKVSKTPDGPADYLLGRDWQRNPHYYNDTIDWSPAGQEPAKGSKYYVTFTSTFDGDTIPRDQADQTGGLFYTLQGSQIVFNRPLGVGQAVFVEYVYGKSSSDGKTLAYQQTGAGNGGFNSIYMDTGYASRYLGKHLAEGFDWLYGYAGFTPQLKQQAVQLLVNWSDYLRVNGYYRNSPASNYGAGEYASRVLTAVALSAQRDVADDARLIANVQDYRDKFVKPLLTNPTTSVKGGFWAEGWNYGSLSIQNILLAEKTLETAGLAREAAGLSPGAEEKLWSGEVLQSLIHEQATQGTIYDAGDGYDYPLPLPSKNLVGLLTATTTSPALKSYGNYILQHYSNELSADYQDLIYRDPSGSSTFWSTLPLQYLATGQGVVTARADWTYHSTWMSFQVGNLVAADHQSNSPGMMEISRGADGLLINAQAESGIQDPQRSQWANMVVIDSNNDLDADGYPVQTYPFNTGDWYGAPGAHLTAYDAQSQYVYAAGDYKAAYSNVGNPGGGGPATQLTRQVVYLRPDLIVVHDRVGTLKADYVKQLRWNFAAAPTMNGNAFVEKVGSSKLFGQTFSSTNVQTTLTAYNTQKDADGNVINPVGYDPRPFYEVITQSKTPLTNLTYTTAFQTAASSTASMVATTQIASSDGKMEGVQMGTSVVLFGKSGVLPASVSTITYQTTGSATQQLLVDLQAGKTYTVVVNGVAHTLQANGQGVIAF